MQTSARSLAHELGRRLGREARDLAALHDDVRRTLPRRSDVDAAWLYLAQAFALLCVVEAARREWAEEQREIDGFEAVQSLKRRAINEIQRTDPAFAAHMASGWFAAPLKPQARVRGLNKALQHAEQLQHADAQLAVLLDALALHGEHLTSHDFTSPAPPRHAGRHDETGLRDAAVHALLALHPQARGAGRWALALRLAGYPADVDVALVRRDMRRRAAAGRPSSEREYLLAQWPRLVDELMASAGIGAVG